MPRNEKESEQQAEFRNARDLIASGRISTLDELYGIIAKKTVAEGLGVNSVSFSNTKANRPEAFKLGEIIKLSELLETDVLVVVAILVKSMK